VAVYTVDTASAEVGARVAVLVVASYETVAPTNELLGFLSSNVVPLIVAAAIASLNVAVTALVTGTFVAPPAGEVAVTVGPVASTAYVAA
jgi:hypothetical protein